MSDFPLCFDSRRQWIDWVQANKDYIESGASHENVAVAGAQFCEPCTPEYRDRMTLQGRCSFPDTYQEIRWVPYGKQVPKKDRVHGVNGEYDAMMRRVWAVNGDLT